MRLCGAPCPLISRDLDRKQDVAPATTPNDVNDCTMHIVVQHNLEPTSNGTYLPGSRCGDPRGLLLQTWMLVDSWPSPAATGPRHVLPGAKPFAAPESKTKG